MGARLVTATSGPEIATSGPEIATSGRDAAISACGGGARLVSDDRREGMDFLVQEGQEIPGISEVFPRRNQVYFDPKHL